MNAQLRTEQELSFQQKSVDFGRVPNDTILYVKYVMENVSNKDVRINYVNPECSCTDYWISKNIVSPKDTASIILKIDTTNKYGKEKLYTIVNYGDNKKMFKLTTKLEVYEK